MKPNTQRNRQADDADPADEFEFLDPIAEFDQVVRQVLARSPYLTRQAAVISAARKNPRLHRAFLLETNPGKRQQRQLREKWEGLRD